jgi:hypothetical protein
VFAFLGARSLDHAVNLPGGKFVSALTPRLLADDLQYFGLWSGTRT